MLCADIDGDAADAAATKIGCGAAACRVDVSDEQQIIAMVDACVAAFGGVDKLVANAGVVHLASLIDTTVEDFDRVIAINLRGAWLCTKHAAPRMIERGGGAIVNLSSLAGQVAVGGTGAYGMSKAGIIPLRITPRMRSSGIRSNTLLPAFVDTPMQQTAMAMFDGALGAGGARSMIARLQGRMAAPEEMAGIVVFLLSDDASMITGTTQIADGGTIAALW
ncbi:short-chain type dehydrogenase/reductase [Mycobacterium tuberculosis CAS/NITR204]|uniref:Short-chain type dehydrogenase/reductase n=1 Tax=Mycobacterium tuberculosis CAS/NITR204 TaxID=1310114 RepID=R4M6Y1_MYCTX|nr:short-chain type dehydrogenase/reductase [Mycobacterium tuberculosis CAS/NITR204]